MRRLRKLRALVTICRREGHAYGTFADKNWWHYRACHRCGWRWWVGPHRTLFSGPDAEPYPPDYRGPVEGQE